MVRLCRWDSSKPLIPRSFRGSCVGSALFVGFCSDNVIFFFLSLSLSLSSLKKKKKNFHRKARAAYQMHIFECLRLGNCNCTEGIVTPPTQRTQAKNPAGVYVVLVLVPSRLWEISQQSSAEWNCTFKKEKPFPPPLPPASVPSVGMLLRTN